MKCTIYTPGRGIYFKKYSPPGGEGGIFGRGKKIKGKKIEGQKREKGKKKRGAKKGEKGKGGRKKGRKKGKGPFKVGEKNGIL